MSDEAMGLDDGAGAATTTTPAPAAPSSPPPLYDGPEDSLDDKDSGAVPTTDAKPEGADDDSSAAQESTEGQATKFNPDLLERAQKAGLSDEDIADFGDEKALRRAVKLIEGRGDSQPKADEKMPAEDQQKDEDFKLGLSPEELEQIDPVLVRSMQTMEGVINRLQSTVKGLKSERDQQEFREFEGWFDRQLGELGDEYVGVFGKGTRAELKQETQEFQNRAKVWKAMSTIVAGIAGRKEKMPSREELFEQALHMALGSKVAEITTKRIGNSVSKRGKQFLNRPTARDSRDVRDPMRRVLSKVDQALQENGFTGSSEDGDF